MEFFGAHGQFWLPQRRQRMVHGRVTFDEDGVRLDLDGPLRPPEVREGGIVGGSPESAEEPLAHGRLSDGRDITLLRLRGWSMPADGMQETWFADFALTHGLISGDAFSQMVIIFDYLMPWVRPPGILRSDLFSSSVTVETQQETLAEAALGDGRTIRLITGVAGRRADDSVHLDQWCGMEVNGPQKSALQVLECGPGHYQDLLVVCTGQPVRIEQVLLGTPEHDPRRAPLELLFKAVQPAARAHSVASHLDSYDSPTLLTYEASPLPFNTLMGAWFALCDRLPDAVTLLCGPYYAPFIHSSHRYASTFQSAEALARAVLRTPGKSPATSIMSGWKQ